MQIKRARPQTGGRLLALAALHATLLLGACSDATVPIDPVATSLEVVADGLADPVLAVAAPGDDRRLYVVEKPGRIRVVLDGELQTTPFLDIDSITSDSGEQGLLGLAFHPSFETNGFVFVNHTDLGGDTRVLRFGPISNPDVADPASLEVVLEVEQPFGNHNGGHIAFGPDGMLYVGMGDGGSGGDPQNHGQRPSTLLGSMLRIEVDALPYKVPTDNPFVGDTSAAPETWAYGLRNPWRFSFDRLTGDLWIGDVGQNRVEEISFQPASSSGGENYGWVTLEGSDCFPSDPCDASGTVLPVYEYPHSDGCSVTGGVVYRGTSLPGWDGRYVFGDFCEGWIRSFRLESGRAVDVQDHTPELGTVPRLSSFGEDGQGELYVLDIGGTIYRLTGS